MRSVLLASSLVLAPGVVFASPPQCALPPAGIASAIPSQPDAADIRSPTLSAVPVIDAAQIARVPAMQRIASNGAVLLDIGTEHGLRGVFARKGNTFQVFYLTPDGQAVIGGVMWSASGQNITRKQVTSFDGAIPTVTIGGTASAPEATPLREPAAITHSVAGADTQPAASVSALKAVESTTSGTIGNATAPKLWVFVDPLCSFSVRAMGQLRSYVAAGRLQLAVIPISVLDYEDQGRSTASAKAMLSLAPDAMVEAWRQDKLTGAADPAADGRLVANMTAAEAIGLRGTPTLVWRRADGSEGRADGLPDNLDALVDSLGS